jgi:putative transposase
MGMQLRYTFRVYPTVPQRIRAARLFGCCRVVFNDAVAARRRAHAEGLPYPSSAELSQKLITEAKRTEERAWLGEVSSVPLQQALRDADAAYANFFASLKGNRKGRKMGPPQFKKRSHRQAARFTRNAGFKVLADGRLRLPKIGDLKIAWSRDPPATPSSVTLLREPSGKYFVSFVVTVEGDETLPPVEDETGIDLGLKSFAVLHGGRTIQNPRFFKRMERRIAKAQRAMARKVKGSANREKARLKVARLHEQTANRRKDFIEQATTRIIRENQAVYVESLSVLGLARGRSAKSVHDAAWGRFVRSLEAKSGRYGREFVAIDRWFPSTRLCSACGALTGPSGQAELRLRRWSCPCGAEHDRDANAEINIRREGRRLLEERQVMLAEGRSSSESGVKPESRNDCGGIEDPHPG